MPGNIRYGDPFLFRGFHVFIIPPFLDKIYCARYIYATGFILVKGSVMKDVLPREGLVSVAVIGDVCLDVYYFIGQEAAEVSVETGLQSFSVLSYKQELGGAGNVAVNCRRLGAKADLYGIIDGGMYGKSVLELLDQSGVGSGGVLIQDSGWQTHAYHKIYNGNREWPRLDMGNMNRPAAALVDRLIGLLEKRLQNYQCVIINEQVPSGINSEYFQKKLNALIDAYKDTVWFADCRKLNDVYKNTIHKLNINEGRGILKKNNVSPDGIKEPTSHFIISWLYRHWGSPVVLTLGENGCLVEEGNGVREINGLHFTCETDAVGAGDAFLAGLAVVYAFGKSLYGAALTGTFCAGVSLCKLFETGHPSREEVLALAADPDYRYHPDLAADERLAVYAPDSEIEIITAPVKGRKGFPAAAIFDHDGTISTLRQGWESIMRTVMIKSITGDPALLPADALKAVEEAVDTLIEKTTGIQTLAQMYRLCDLIARFGYVSRDNILPPEEYKAVYNRALMAAIEDRIRLAANGLPVEDATIKGAVQFVKTLHEKGTRLFLASGTDEDDVRREAELLGYAGYFSGGIRGSAGDIHNDPKKIVIGGIAKELKMSGGQGASPAGCVVFGDGPVEMREAKKNGFLAIGVLSDEVRRCGRNAAKRERLILGGADILIPDFSHVHKLASLCGWE
jgi:bifunctional ADP-heptose synthase (sugar kinase/adenylyltransferase)/phosphoglycolate phosphatase-like HAD superfamily hydrolase